MATWIKKNKYRTAQSVIEALGTFTSFSGKALYELQSDKYWEILLEVVRDWRALSPNLPPLYWNIKAGLGVTNWENYSGFSTFNIASGVHYKF